MISKFERLALADFYTRTARYYQTMADRQARRLELNPHPLATASYPGHLDEVPSPGKVIYYAHKARELRQHARDVDVS